MRIRLNGRGQHPLRGRAMGEAKARGRRRAGDVGLAVIYRADAAPPPAWQSGDATESRPTFPGWAEAARTAERSLPTLSHSHVMKNDQILAQISEFCRQAD